MGRGTIIEIRDLTKAFGNILAVNKVKLEILEAELFAFLGPNGAGKTTLIRLLTCLLKPSSGTAIVGGHDTRKEPLQIRMMVGVVTQEPCLYTDLTGEENIRFFGRLYGVGGERLEKKSEELLELVKLKGREKDLVGTYSGGMRQRLSIACALVHDPRIIFFDEPTAGLDPQTKRAIWGFMKDLKKRGITIVLSTHYMEEADALSDRVAIMDRGRIVAVDMPERLKESLSGVEEPTLEDVFLSLTGREMRD
jgi:ABC-2 type transport system ATP-binding protein